MTAADEMRADYLRGWTAGAAAAEPYYGTSLSYRVGYGDGRTARRRATERAGELISDDVVEYGA